MIKVILTVIISLLVLVSFGQGNSNQDTVRVNSPLIKVTLLGTGTPQPIMDRFSASTLVQAGTQTLLFDAGRGCLQRLRQLNVSYDQLDAIFLTHLHSDHIVGLPDLWLTGWLVSKREIPMNLYGPAGTSDMINYLQKAFDFDIKMRISDDKAPEEGSKFIVNEIKQGIIYEKNGVKVIAIEVDHYPVIPAFGFRIEYQGHSVVLSGDTRFSENLIKYAKGADLLIHEVVIGPDTLSKSDPKYSIWSHHTKVEQASQVFNEVRPKLAAYSHISKLYGHNEEELLKRTKAKYSGPVIIGEDLMSFSIGDTVTVSTWPKK